MRRLRIGGRAAALAAIVGALCLMSSCSFFRGIADRRTGFSKSLAAVEDAVRGGDWPAAAAGLRQAWEAWKKIKPLLQVDIDHDYVNQIQDQLTVLRAHVETEAKPDALAGILLIREIWDDLGSL